MNSHNRIPNILLSPLRSHSASPVLLPNNTASSLRHTPSVRLSSLNFHSAKSFNIPRTNTNSIPVFRNNLRIRISPIKSPILRKYNIKPSRSRGYHSIYNCNSKRCGCCNFLSHRSTITSNVNGRTFNVKFDSDVNCNTSHLIYVLT